MWKGSIWVVAGVPGIAPLVPKNDLTVRSVYLGSKYGEERLFCVNAKRANDLNAQSNEQSNSFRWTTVV